MDCNGKKNAEKCRLELASLAEKSIDIAYKLANNRDTNVSPDLNIEMRNIIQNADSIIIETVKWYDTPSAIVGHGYFDTKLDALNLEYDILKHNLNRGEENGS